MSDSIIHDDVLYWPNGMGERACSREYRETQAKRDAIYETGVSDGTLDDLSPEDYQRWMVLDHKLDQMHLNGHLGEVTRY